MLSGKQKTLGKRRTSVTRILGGKYHFRYNYSNLIVHLLVFAVLWQFVYTNKCLFSQRYSSLAGLGCNNKVALKMNSTLGSLYECNHIASF